MQDRRSRPTMHGPGRQTAKQTQRLAIENVREIEEGRVGVEGVSQLHSVVPVVAASPVPRVRSSLHQRPGNRESSVCVLRCVIARVTDTASFRRGDE